MNKQDLEMTIRRYDDVISKLSQLESISRGLGGDPSKAMDLTRSRWQAELLRAGAIFELAQLENLRAVP
jgi:hypothetical protein